jgi:hypothetical protein
VPWDDAPPKPEEIAPVKAGAGWDATPPEPEELGTQSFGQKALGMIGTGAKYLDSVTGAPMRAGISAAQEGKNPLPAAAHQFANMNEEAPTGKDIVARAGVPNEEIPYTAEKFDPKDPNFYRQFNDPTYGHPKATYTVNPAGVAGAGMELAANPLNFAGPVAKAAGKVAEYALPVAEEAAGAAKPSALSSFANRKALSAAGYTGADLKKLGGRAEQLGAWANEKKLIGPLTTARGAAARAQSIMDDTGEAMGALLKSADTSGAVPVDGTAVGLKLLEDPEITASRGVPGPAGKMYEIAKGVATQLADRGEMGLVDAHEYRMLIDKGMKRAFKQGRDALQPGEAEVLWKVRDILNNSMNSSVNGLRGHTADALKSLNRDYSNAASIYGVASKRADTVAGHDIFSLKDIAAGLGVGHMSPYAPSKSLPVAIGAGLASKAARTYGPALMSTGARVGAGLLEDTPGLLQGTGAATEIGRGVGSMGLIPARVPAQDKKK